MSLAFGSWAGNGESCTLELPFPFPHQFKGCSYWSFWNSNFQVFCGAVMIGTVCFGFIASLSS